jgi:hypothetical protein
MLSDEHERARARQSVVSTARYALLRLVLAVALELLGVVQGVMLTRKKEGTKKWQKQH